MPIWLLKAIEFHPQTELVFGAHRVTLLLVIMPLTFLCIHIKTYDLIILGSGIMVIGYFPFVYDEATYFRVQIWASFIAVGEALVMPRFIEYAYNLAPKNKEGVFLSLGICMLCLSSLIGAVEVGALMKEYCNPSPLIENKCTIVMRCMCVFSFTAFLVLFAIRRYMIEPESETQKYISCSKEAQEEKSL